MVWKGKKSIKMDSTKLEIDTKEMATKGPNYHIVNLLPVATRPGIMYIIKTCPIQIPSKATNLQALFYSCHDSDEARSP